MMVKFVVFFALVLQVHIVVQGCMQNDNNQCTSNKDCCSGNCWKGNANWATGVCKSRDGNGNNGNNGGGGSGLITQDQFNRAVTSSGYPTPRPGQYQGFKNGLSKGDISTKREAAMALAQFMHESDGLRAKEEYDCMKTKCPNSYTNSERRCEVHGKYYYGRGYIQLSWCYNYQDAGQGLNLGDKLLNNPDLVASNEQYAWDTAFWFWRERVRKGQYGAQVQAGQFGYSTRAINGKEECTGQNVNKSKSRFRIYQNVYRAFGVEGQPDERGCY